MKRPRIADYKFSTVNDYTEGRIPVMKHKETGEYLQDDLNRYISYLEAQLEKEREEKRDIIKMLTKIVDDWNLPQSSISLGEKMQIISNYLTQTKEQLN